MTQRGDLVGRVERAIVFRGIVATISTIAPLWIGGRIAGPDLLSSASRAAFERLFLIGPLVTCVVGLSLYAIAAHRILRRGTTWLAEGRAPTVAERHGVTRLAWRLTLFLSPVWFMAIAFLPPASRAIRFANGFVVSLGFLGFVIAGTVTLAFAYVLIEDALRPLYAIALNETQTRPERAVGLLQRFGLYWLIGSGLNLFSTALVLIVLPQSGRRVAIVFCAFGALVGAGLTILAARSVTDRVERLLENVHRVEEGDLTTATDVDDLGEIGRLQRGFNRMVAGLRERDRLGDLFGRHVGADVVRRALDAGGREGSEQNVSVLFIDVIGSTTLASGRPAREVVAMLNGLFDAVVRVVGTEGGLVNQFQGDGALCIFGAPLPMSDHAARALRAVRAISREFASLRDAFPEFDAAIGVSTGDVVAGDIGNEDRYQYTVIGDPVNEASRLCDEAKLRAGRVLVSGSTIAAASQEGWTSGGEVSLRGRRQPTAVFEPNSVA